MSDTNQTIIIPMFSHWELIFPESDRHFNNDDLKDKLLLPCSKSDDYLFATPVLPDDIDVREGYAD